MEHQRIIIKNLHFRINISHSENLIHCRLNVSCIFSLMLLFYIAFVNIFLLPLVILLSVRLLLLTFAAMVDNHSTDLNNYSSNSVLSKPGSLPSTASVSRGLVYNLLRRRESLRYDQTSTRTTLNETLVSDTTAESCFNDAMLISSIDTITSDTSNSVESKSVSTPLEETLSDWEKRNTSNSVLSKPGSLPSTASVSRGLMYNVLRRRVSLHCDQTSTRTTLNETLVSDTTAESCFDNAMLMSSIDTITSDTSYSVESESVSTPLEETLSDWEERSSQHNDNEIIDKLYEKYNYNPRSFTESLVTIIEEHSMNISLNTQQQYISSINNSTQYLSFEYCLRNYANSNAFTKTPIIIINNEIWNETMNHVTPRINVIPGTPEMQNHYIDESPSREIIIDDDYLTAESDIDESDDTIINDSTMSQNETINMSKVALHYAKWSSTHEKLSRYKPTNKISSASVAFGKEKITKYTNKLENKLSKRREKCFAMVNHLLNNFTTKVQQSKNESLALLCKCCQRKREFYDTLIACSDYFAETINARESPRLTRTIEEEKCCSVTKSPAQSNDRKSSNSQNIHQPGRKQSRKSLGYKIKSPSTRYKNPHLSIIVKPSIRKSPAIDRSSTQSVAQLRKMFSPGLKNHGSSGLKIQVPKQGVQRTFVTKVMMNPLSSGKRVCPAKQFGVAGSSPKTHPSFKHIISPVGEYIRGKKSKVLNRL